MEGKEGAYITQEQYKALMGKLGDVQKLFDGAQTPEDSYKGIGKKMEKMAEQIEGLEEAMAESVDKMAGEGKDKKECMEEVKKSVELMAEEIADIKATPLFKGMQDVDAIEGAGEEEPEDLAKGGLLSIIRANYNTKQE